MPLTGGHDFTTGAAAGWDAGASGATGTSAAGAGGSFAGSSGVRSIFSIAARSIARLPPACARITRVEVSILTLPSRRSPERSNTTSARAATAASRPARMIGAQRARNKMRGDMADPRRGGSVGEVCRKGRPGQVCTARPLSRLLPAAGVVSSAHMRPPPSPVGRCLGAGLVLLAGLFLGTGCVTGWRAKAGVYDAFYQNQTGDNVAALAQIQRALRQCAWPGVPGYVVIEAYDDAGLYYFLNDRPREAFLHQAVAVLLAEVIETPAAMRAIYLDRLLQALAAADIALEPAAIRADRRVLLTLPEVRENPRVRHYYGSQATPR